MRVSRRRFVGTGAAAAALCAAPRLAARQRGGQAGDTAAIPASIRGLKPFPGKPVPIADDERRARIEKARKLMTDSGMGAIVLDNAEVGELSLIGAGALITANTKIPPRSLVLGSPAKVVREVNDRDIAMILGGVEVYVQKAREYRAAQSSK